MSIHQTLMGLGDFRCRVRDDTPRSMTDNINEWDLLVITPGIVNDGAASRANLLAQARYVGRIETFDATRHDWAGESALVFLGDGDNPMRGPFDATLAPILPPKTFAQFVTATFATPARVGGLTLGTAYASPATVILGDGVQGDEAPRQAFQRLAKIVGAEFRMNPNGSFDFGDPATLWKSGANIDVLLAPDRAGHEADGLKGLNVSNFKAKHIASEQVGGEVVQGNGTLYDSGILGGWNGFDGTTSYSPRKYLTTSSSDIADLAAYGNAYQAANFQTRYEISCDVDEFDPGQYFTAGQPGDFVAIYSPDDMIVDTSNQRAFQGEWIHPLLTHRVVEWTYPVRAGMGVYVISITTGTNTIYNFTDYMVWETGTTSLKLATQLPFNPSQAVNGTR